jgi:hypothetical protein
VNRQRIDAGHWVEAVTEHPHRIGQVAAAPLAGLDQRQPKVTRIERKTRQRAGEATVTHEHERDRRMGQLCVLCIIG